VRLALQLAHAEGRVEGQLCVKIVGGLAELNQPVGEVSKGGARASRVHLREHGHDGLLRAVHRLLGQEVRQLLNHELSIVGLVYERKPVAHPRVHRQGAAGDQLEKLHGCGLELLCEVALPHILEEVLVPHQPVLARLEQLQHRLHHRLTHHAVPHLRQAPHDIRPAHKACP